MKKFLSTYQEAFGVLNYVAFLLVLVSLAFPWRFTQPLFAIWLISWLLEGRWASLSNFSCTRHTVPLLLMCGFVGWEALSLLWTQDLSTGTSELERHLPVFAILLVALFGGNHFYKAHRLKTAVVAGCLLALLSYCVIVYWFMHTGEITRWNFSYWTFFAEGPIEHLIHRSDLCIVLIVSLLFTVDLYTYYKNRYPAVYTGLIAGSVICALLASIIMTGSRTAIFLTPLLVCIVFFKLYNGRRTKEIALAVITGAIVLIGISANYNSRLKSVTADLTQLKESGTEAIESTREPRLQIYSCALRHLDRYGVFGVGFGSSEAVLQELYVEDGLDLCAQSGYGIHNRYFKVLMEMGPFALLFMLFIVFGSPFFHSGPARHDTAYICLAFGWSMLTENVITMISAIYILFALVTLVEIEQRESDSPQPARP